MFLSLCLPFLLSPSLSFSKINKNIPSVRTYLFFREKGREGERERTISVWLPLTRPLLGTWPTTQACALTGNRTSDPLVLRLALNH